jgi:hypothetical protein
VQATGRHLAFVRKEAVRGFLKLLFTKDQRVTQIEVYIDTSIDSFQASTRIIKSVVLIDSGQTCISALLNIHVWQTMSDDARADDQRALNERLLHLETNRQRLTRIETLSMSATQ